MEPSDLLRRLLALEKVADVEAALQDFERDHPTRYVPFGGRENNRGIIEVSADPGRSLVERVTNGIDGVLELEHDKHNGQPICKSPVEAAMCWLGVPPGGLSEMSPAQRRQLAQRVTVKVLEGDGTKESRVVDVLDGGIGLKPDEMPSTILSLNESNKIKKHYLAGTYGQGGSSTLAVSKYCLIASRAVGHPTVGFTIVRYVEPPPDEAKTGSYVYLTLDGKVLEAALPESEFPAGTLCRHYGYDLSGYASPLGPNSVYGLLNRILFDPVMPVWLENTTVKPLQRRVIKGVRNALNGATDEGDEATRGPKLDHHLPLFYVTHSDFGRIGIEYWVLEQPAKENKRPTAAFVNPNKPIVLTHNGQNQAELTVTLIRKDADLPFLTQRVICHVNCDLLTPQAKRLLFASTREEARRGIVLDHIREEVVKALKSDDELARLNIQAKEQSMKEHDEEASKRLRSEVARLLKLYGVEAVEGLAGQVTEGKGTEPPAHPRGPRPKPKPIELHEPPTYIRIVWEEGKTFGFYPGQRRYIRIETDAPSNYHDHKNPDASRINVITTLKDLKFCGTSPLQGGRMRAIFEAILGAKLGSTGTIRVELARQGLPMLFDERPVEIVEQPPAKPAPKKIALPLLDVRPVHGPDDPTWGNLGWPEDITTVASSAEKENGQLVVYYSEVYPDYVKQVQTFEAKDPALARSFTDRYRIWLAVHSLLLDRDYQLAGIPQVEQDEEAAEARERQERCRVATLAALYARHQVLQPTPEPATEET